ncbi:hypothetical protein RB195_023788 [Necator americanus]|uniref:Reverse transcriptase domain-containing protein n=1 Tax=Necator americanus TaxID=51031 RepID=A0ABR1EKK0_NECAM
MQLVFPDLKADFDSLHRSHLLKTLRADRVAGKFVCIPDGMNQRTTAAVRTDAVGERSVVAPFPSNFVIGEIMRKAVDHCPADIVLAPSGFRVR